MAATEIPGLPRSGGPPHVKNHTGKAITKSRHPEYQLVLPGGVFHLVWELVEARALDCYNKYSVTLPHVVDAYKEAVEEFRAVGHGAHMIVEEDDEIILEDDDEMLPDDDDEDVILDDDEEELL